MTISERGIEFIKVEEGFRENPYKDNRESDYCSWGFGTKVLCAFGNQVGGISRAEAEAEMQAFIDFEVIPLIEKYLPNHQLNQNQFDALCSLIYNVGPGNVFTKKYGNGYTSGSTVYNRILLGDYEGAGKAFNTTGWQNVNRRTRERALWEKEDYSNTGAPKNAPGQIIESIANTLNLKKGYLYAGAAVIVIILMIVIFKKRQTGFYPWMY